MQVTVPCFAKLNLDLRVLHKRPDNYHEMRTIFQTISLKDTLEMPITPNGTLARDIIPAHTGDTFESTSPTHRKR